MSPLKNLKWHVRGLWAGVGGCVPILIKVIKTDVDVFSSFDSFNFIGWAIKTVAYFILGALFGIAHKKENDMWELMKKGIIAPAIAILLMQSNPQDMLKTPEAAELGFNINFATSLYADDIPAQENSSTNDITIYRPFYDDEISAWYKIYQGITGQVEKRVWYVIAYVGSEKSCKYELKNFQKEFSDAKIFNGYWIGTGERTTHMFAVVIMYDTNKENALAWVDHVQKKFPTYHVRLWDGRPLYKLEQTQKPVKGGM